MLEWCDPVPLAGLCFMPHQTGQIRFDKRLRLAYNLWSLYWSTDHYQYEIQAGIADAGSFWRQTCT